MPPFYLCDADRLTSSLESNETTLKHFLESGILCSDIYEDLKDSSLGVNFTIPTGLKGAEVIGDINGVYLNDYAGVIVAQETSIQEPTKVELISIVRRLWRTYTDSNQGLYRIGIDITEKGAVSHHYEELQAFHKIDAAWYAIYLVADKYYKQRASINKQLHCCVGRKTNLKVSQRGVLYEVKTVVQVS